MDFALSDEQRAIVGGERRVGGGLRRGGVRGRLGGARQLGEASAYLRRSGSAVLLGEPFPAAATPPPDDWREAMRHWNGVGTADWARWLDRLPAWQSALEDWRSQLLAQPDLATQLMRFHADRVESRPT